MLKPSLSSGRDVAVADVAYDGGAYEVPAEARAGAWARLCTRVRVAPQRETNCLGYVLAARCGRSQRHRAHRQGRPAQLVPDMRPFTNQRCMTTTTSTGGTIARSATAITKFHWGTAKL